MSLLIDALRQAEQARQEAGTPAEPLSPAPMSTLQLEAVASPAAAHPGLEPLDRIRPASPAAAPPDGAQQAARQLFEVKQAAPSKLPLMLALFALICLVAGLLYLWWATQPRSQITQRTFAAIPPAEKPLPVLPQSATPPQPADALPALPEPPKPRPRKPMPPATAPDAAEPVPAQPATTPLRLKRSPPARQELTALQQAHAAYQQGELARAYELYRETLRTDPKNADALTALGTLALRAGRPEEAKRYLREALAADPKHPTARSQLLMLLADADPTTAESTLQTLIAEQPQSPELYFALGSLHARAARWKEAQQAFFQAYSLDNKNPDVLYNLAVSLDHLRQAKLARQFYERAASAAQTGTASFDPASAQRRAQQLTADTDKDPT